MFLVIFAPCCGTVAVERPRRLKAIRVANMILWAVGVECWRAWRHVRHVYAVDGGISVSIESSSATRQPSSMVGSYSVGLKRKQNNRVRSEVRDNIFLLCLSPWCLRLQQLQSRLPATEASRRNNFILSLPLSLHRDTHLGRTQRHTDVNGCEKLLCQRHPISDCEKSVESGSGLAFRYCFALSARLPTRWRRPRRCSCTA